MICHPPYDHSYFISCGNKLHQKREMGKTSGKALKKALCIYKNKKIKHKNNFSLINFLLVLSECQQLRKHKIGSNNGCTK